MAGTDAALQSAIAEAEGQLLKETGKTTTSPVETQTTSTDDTKDDTTDDTTSDDTSADSTTEELSESQLKEAQTLYKALLNPELRNGIVAALAEQAGILRNQPLETKTEVKAAKKNIAAIIEEALPEYPGLATKLGPVIESIIDTERSERNSEMETIHAQNVEREVINELDLLAKETKGESRKFEVKMNQLMADFAPGPNTTVKNYLRNLYTLATASNTKAKVSSEMADKIRRNANNAADRLKTNTGTARTFELPNKKMNLNESITWAAEQLKNGKNK
jgi:hypothetical protein